MSGFQSFYLFFGKCAASQGSFPLSTPIIPWWVTGWSCTPASLCLGHNSHRVAPCPRAGAARRPRLVRDQPVNRACRPAPLESSPPSRPHPISAREARGPFEGLEGEGRGVELAVTERY